MLFAESTHTLGCYNCVSMEYYTDYYIFLQTSKLCVVCQHQSTFGEHRFWFWSLHRHNGTNPGNLNVITRLQEAAHICHPAEIFTPSNASWNVQLQIIHSLGVLGSLYHPKPKDCPEMSELPMCCFWSSYHYLCSLQSHPVKPWNPCWCAGHRIKSEDNLCNYLKSQGLANTSSLWTVLHSTWMLYSPMVTCYYNYNVTNVNVLSGKL